MYVYVVARSELSAPRLFWCGTFVPAKQSKQTVARSLPSSSPAETREIPESTDHARRSVAKDVHTHTDSPQAFMIVQWTTLNYITLTEIRLLSFIVRLTLSTFTIQRGTSIVHPPPPQHQRSVVVIGVFMRLNTKRLKPPPSPLPPRVLWNSELLVPPAANPSCSRSGMLERESAIPSGPKSIRSPEGRKTPVVEMLEAGAEPGGCACTPSDPRSRTWMARSR